MEKVEYDLQLLKAYGRSTFILLGLICLFLLIADEFRSTLRLFREASG